VFANDDPSESIYNRNGRTPVVDTVG